MFIVVVPSEYSQFHKIFIGYHLLTFFLLIFKRKNPNFLLSHHNGLSPEPDATCSAGHCPHGHPAMVAQDLKLTSLPFPVSGIESKFIYYLYIPINLVSLVCCGISTSVFLIKSLLLLRSLFIKGPISY